MDLSQLSKKLGALAITSLSILMSDSAKGQSGNYNGFLWSQSGNAITITGYNGAGGNIAIPGAINGLPVTTIGYEAFYTSGNIGNVTIPSGITTIGPFAFESSSLTGITIPDGVTTIGANSFAGCASLTRISIPDSVTSLGVSSFSHTGLTSVRIGNGVTSLPADIFFGSSHLKNIVIPPNVEYIFDDAFYECTSLTSITIPPNVSWIGGSTFSGCTSLANVCFEGNRPSIEDDGDGFLFDGDPLAVVNYIFGTQGWSSSFDTVPTAPCYDCYIPINNGNLYNPLDLPEYPAQNLALVIQGWTPGTSATPVTDDGALPKLELAIEGNPPPQVAGTWDVIYYDWSNPNVTYTSQTQDPGPNPIQSVRNAVNLGDILGQQLAQSPYQNILIIGHSAGAWMASGIGSHTVAAGIHTSVTFLDAFVPSQTQFPFNIEAMNYTPDRLGNGIAGNGIGMVEHYFHSDSRQDGLGITLKQAVNYDITALQKCANDKGEAHSWAIRWYTETIDDPSVCWADVDGYQNAFMNISGPVGPAHLLCPNCGPSSGQGQSAMANAMINNRNISAIARASISPPDLPPLPPLPSEMSLMRHRVLQTSTAPSQPLNNTSGMEPQGQTNAPPGSPQFGLFGSDVAFTNLTVLRQGGNGTVTCDTNGVDFSTSNFVWETFSVNTTNDITLGTVEYTLSTPCDSVLGLYLDGQPIQYIQSTTNNPLTSYEIFPLSSALAMGNHALTVSLESLDGTPITATLNTVGFYYMVDQPIISPPSVDTNGNFVLTWEAGAGLNYQPQYISDLTSTNWQNLGGLLSSPTNAIMSAFDAIATHQQRFYRVSLVQ